MTASTASFHSGKLFELLVITCKCLDLMDKVDALPFMPLLHDSFAYGNVFNALEVEGGKVLKDNELVDLGKGKHHVLSICHIQVFLDLFLQIQPFSNIICIPCSCHWVYFLFVNKVYHVLFLCI